jgi:parallel beta-helix repeat protein
MSSRRAAELRKASKSSRTSSRDRQGVSKLVGVLAIAVMAIAAAALVLFFNPGSANGNGLQASFAMDHDQGTTPLTVHFTDTSTGSPTEWEWDLDGDTVVDSHEQNPTWTYRFGGEYNVTLTVHNDASSDAAVKTVTVSAILTADFSYAPSEGNAPLTVQFTDLSTGNRSKMTYAWDFGDGSAVSNEHSPKHTYVKEGEFTVILTVSEGILNQSKSATVNVALIPPKASFVVQTADPKVGTGVYFQDTSANAPSNWTWEFGDGTVGYGRQPTPHVYTNPGDYTVVLTARNEAGGNSTQQVIHVRELTVQALFSVDIDDGYAPLVVHFTDHSVITAHLENATWHWEFGDGAVSEDRNPIHTYNVGRDVPYQVNLTVSNGLDTAVMTYDITIYASDSPVVDFVGNPRVGTDIVIVQFTDLSTNTPTNWTWDLDGDGDIDSYEQNPTFQYGYGSYDVTLNASNEFGWTILTKPEYIVVSAISPEAGFVSDVTDGGAPLIVHFTDTSLNHPLEWRWDFGDGTTSDEQNPVHTFNDIGTYQVKLNVTNLAGSSECQKTITVVPRVVDMAVDLRSDLGWATVYDDIVFSIDLENTGTVNLDNLHVTLTFEGRKPTIFVDEYDSVSAGGKITITYHYTVSWGDTESKSLNVTLNVAAATGEEYSDKLAVSMVRTTYSWTSSGGDNYNSGYSYEAGPIGPEAPLLSWFRDLDGDVNNNTFAQPLIVEMKRPNGEIMDVILVSEPYPMAIDLYTGLEIWNRSDLGGFKYTPVYSDGVLYLIGMFEVEQGKRQICLGALNARNGADIWHCTEVVGAITPIKYDDGRLYLGAYYTQRDAGLFCIDAVTGEVQWSLKNYAPAQFGAPAIVGSYVVWPSGSGTKVVVTDKITGAISDVVDLTTVAWGNEGIVIPDIGPIKASVVYNPDTGRLYLTTLGKWVGTSFKGILLSMAYDPIKGDVVERDNWLTFLPAQSSAAPVVYGDKIYVGTGSFLGGSMVAYWERNGTLIGSVSSGSAQCHPTLSLYGGEPVLYWSVNQESGLAVAYGAGERAGFYFAPEEGAYYSMSGAVPYKNHLVYMNDRGYIFCLQNYSADPSLDPQQTINYDTATVGNLLEYKVDIVNDGNIDFRNIKVKVTMEGYAISGYTIVDEMIDLAAGSTKTYHFSYAVTAMDVQGTDIRFNVECSVDGHAFSNSTVVVMITPAFRIDSDAEMDDMASSRGWSGSGTASDPYVIAGYFVDGRQGGIYIGNTTRYFILRDVEVSGNGAGAGIELLNVINGVIADSLLHDNKYGIHAKNSVVIIRSNIIANNTGYGVLLEDCTGCQVCSNHFLSNNKAGNNYVYLKRQAMDDGDNAWDVAGTGNLWSDILGTRVQTYMIAPGVYDNHPLGINDADWEGSMDDAQGSGSNTAPSPDDAEEYWTASLGSPLVSEPIMADGLVIFVTAEGLYVYDDAGHLKWSDRSYASDNGTTPCYSDGQIYIAYPKTPTTASIVIRAYNAFNGSVIWQADSIGTWKTPSSPLRVYDGLVLVVGSRDDSSALLCLDNRTGGMKWTYSCDGARGFVVVGEHVIIANVNGTLVSVATSSGSTVDTVDIFEHFPILDESVLSSSISYDVVSCSIYAVTEGRDLVCLGFDPLTGRFLPSNVREGYTVPLRLPGSTPAVSDDAVYVICNNLVYAIDKTTGHVKWMYQLRSTVTSSPAVSMYYEGDLIYIVCEERVICLDSNGQVKWQLAPKDYALCYDSTYGAAIAGTLLSYGNDLGNVMVVKKRIDLSLDLKIETNRWDAHVGDVITITLTATNDGNVRLDSLPLYFVRIVNNEVVDTYIDTILDLGIGQTNTYTYYYTVTQQDFDYGNIYFKATSSYSFQDSSFDLVIYHSLGMTHDPAVIDGDDELRAFAEQNNLMGDGSIENPYVLATWLINAEDARYCLSISNTTLHFVISDCVFHNATDASVSEIRDPDDPAIINPTRYNNNTVYGPGWVASPHEMGEALYAGIHLYQASNITIQGCTFEGCYVSIEVVDSQDIVINGVEIEIYPAVGSIGISVMDCERVSITGSTLIGLGFEDAQAFQEALDIYWVEDLIKQFDLVGWYGIRIVDSVDVVIDGNTFTNFRPYHASYTNRELVGGTDTYRPYVWITGYTGSSDAWSILIDRSERISLTDNTFTDSNSVSVRADDSTELLIDGCIMLCTNSLTPNLQLNSCTDIEIANSYLYNSRLTNCNDVLVSRNEIMVLDEDLTNAYAYASGILVISGNNAVVSNNTGGNLYISGTGHVIRDNAYRSIVLDETYDSLVSSNSLSPSKYDLFVQYPMFDQAGGFPLMGDSNGIYDWYKQPLVTGTIILVDSDRINVWNNLMNIYLFGSSYNNISHNVMEGGKSFGGYCISRPGMGSGGMSYGWGGEVLAGLFYNYTGWSDGIHYSRGIYGVGLEIAGDVEHESEYNVIWNNTISHTRSYGILINDIYCHFNLIYENVLDSNNGATKSYDLSEQAQALDKGQLNQWNTTTKIGNYWSDWQHRNGPYCVSDETQEYQAYDLYPMSYPLKYWEQYRMDEQGTAAIDSNGLFDPNNLTADWSFVMDKLYTGAITVEPVTGDGKVFVVDANSYIYAIDIDSGELKWAVNPIKGDNYGIESCTPAYNGKVLYVVLQCRVSSTTVSAVALSTADGSVLWTTTGINTQGGRVDSPVRYDSGRIYFGSSGANASLYCLSATNGSILWAYKTAADVSRSGVTVVGDYVIFGDLSGALYVLNSTGAVKSTFNVNSKAGITNAGINSTAVYADGRLYFTASSKTVGYCFSIGIDASGQLKSNEIRWTTIDPTSSSPALYNGYIYVGSGKVGATYGKLYCIEADTGRAIWSRVLNGPVLASPTIMIMFHGDIYAGVTTANTVGGLYIYDNDGEMVFSHVPPEDEAGYCMQGAAIFDEAMIYANSRGYVYSIASNGSLPKAAFIALPKDGAVPLEVQFRDCSMYDPDSWEWDFNGDGIVDSHEKDPVYTYPGIGKYSVTLKVTNFKGTAGVTREYYIDVQPRNPSIDAAAIASVLSVTNPGDDITYKLGIVNDGNLHLFGVTIDTVLIAHLREGGTEIRHFDTQTIDATRNNIKNFYLDYTLTADDLDCTYLECVYYINHTAEGLSYQVSAGVYIKIPHDPISIDGDDDLIATAAAEGWHGDGSAEHPFIIENYDIRVHSVLWDGDILDGSVPKVIELRNTSLHVIVRNCTTVAITDTPLKQGDAPNATAIHILLVNCSNVTLSNNIITPIAEDSLYLNDNLNCGVVMVNCHDNLVEDITMPAYRAASYPPDKHSVNTAILLMNSRNNVFRDIEVEERFYRQSGVVVQPEVVLLKDSEDNVLDGLFVRSGGITILNSDRTVLVNAYAMNGLILTSSDDCVLHSFSGYQQVYKPNYYHIPSTITVTNCNSLHIYDCTFTDLVTLSASRGLIVENTTFIGTKLDMVNCQDSIINDSIFEQNCGTAIGMTDCSGVVISNNTMDMLWYIWLKRPNDLVETQFWYKGMGISMNVGCSRNTVANNTVLNCETGIAGRGNENLIRDNTVVNCTAGILLKGSDTVINNTLEACIHGVRLEESDGGRVVDNHLYNSDLYIGPKSKNTMVDNNDLHDGTFVIDVTSSTSANLKTITITDTNTVNGGSFVFFIGEDLEGETISEAGQLLLIEVSNAVIDGVVVHDGYNAITAINSHYLTIRNVELSNMELSVMLTGCDHIAIEDSHLQGLKISSSMYCNITDCVLNGSVVDGITIESSRYVGIDDVIVSNGTASGIAVRSNSQDVDIRYNTIENNGANGIFVQNSTKVNILYDFLESNYRNSIYLENSTRCNVLNNTMIDGLNGVLCESSSYMVIRNNIFVDHLRYGVSLGPGSNNNEVVNNRFDGNHGSGSFFRSIFVQAEDLGINNKWSDTNGGNYWYDWQNMDGMPYVISSNPRIVDPKPLDLRYIDPWNSPQHDGYHHGSSSSTVPSTNATAWTVDDFRLVDGSSVVSGAGMVFVQSVDVNGKALLCAFGAEDGELVWSVPIKNSKMGSTFTPVYCLGLVYAPGGAYDAFTGKQVWKDTVTDHAGGGYLVYNHVAIIGDWGTSSLLAYNATTGQLLWTLPLVGSPESAPTICGQDIILTTVSEMAGHVYRISLSGTVVWQKTFDGYDNRTVGSATVNGNVIYITTLNNFGYGHLYALNAANGEEIWSIEIVSSASPVAVQGDRLYVSSGFDDALGRRTYCIDASNGNIIWQKSGVGSAYCSPAVADGKVIVGNHETGLLYGELWFIGTFILDANTGAEVWHYDQGGSSSMVYDGRVYTIGDGRLVVFGA